MIGFEYFLRFLLGPTNVHGGHFSFTRKSQVDNGQSYNTHLLAKLFPALKEVMWSHLSWLEELVDSDRQLECKVLQSSTIPIDQTHTHTQSDAALFFFIHSCRSCIWCSYLLYIYLFIFFLFDYFVCKNCLVAWISPARINKVALIYQLCKILTSIWSWRHFLGVWMTVWIAEGCPQFGGLFTSAQSLLLICLQA